jgi:3-isopropylmalate dehydrogenase
MGATIAVMPGDGIGPEVVAEGIRVLHAVGEQFGHAFHTTDALIGGAALEARGMSLPPETVAAARSADAVLLGAVGGPQWEQPGATDRPEKGLLAIRKALGLYANLRPVTVDPFLAAVSPLRADRLHGVDLVVVRELTGGLYFGARGREPVDNGDGERAFDTCEYTSGEIERVVRVAARLARLARARRGKLTSVDKANVLATSQLWRAVVTRLARDEFPDLEGEHLLVDACAMDLLRRPADFDVIVTENMFGDILTDEASMLTGSMGMLPSASLGTRRTEHGTFGLYEPIHGTAPDITGQGKANPVAAILSAAMLLRFSLGLMAEAEAIEKAVARVIKGGSRTADIARPGEGTLTTEAMGEAIAAAINGSTAAPRRLLPMK